MSNKEFEITAVLPAVGVQEAPEVNYKDIFANETAFNMFLNKVQETDVLYSIKVREVEEKTKIINELYQRINMVERKASERLSAVLIATVAEIITAIGIGIMSPSDNKFIPILVILAGLFMNGISLWLNFKPIQKDEKRRGETQCKQKRN